MEALSLLGLARKFWPHALVGLSLIGMAFALWWVKAERDDARDDLRKARVELSDVKTENALLRQDAKAKEVAGVERATDNAAVAANQKGLIDAIKTVPDTAPDAVRVALGCERLRQQQRARKDASPLPAVCRPEGRSEAGGGAGNRDKRASGG